MSQVNRTLKGVGVSPGRSAAAVVVATPPAPPGTSATTDTPEEARERILEAGETVRAQLDRAARATEGQARSVLEATAAIAIDPSFLDSACDLARNGVGTARAVWEAAGRIIDDLTALGDPMAERSRDVADVRDRIVAVLSGSPGPDVVPPDHPFVLVAGDLAPADVAMLDPAKVRGLVTMRGGPVSHTAILARAMGIPTVMGVKEAVGLRTGTIVVVDGSAGTVTLDVSPEDALLATRPPRQPRPLAGPGRTADGRPIALMANVGRPDEAQIAATAGAEGIGLLRTEFCFLGRREAPEVYEQVAEYRAVFAAFPGRTVVVRTLDAGSDIDLPYLTTHPAPNPALGARGVRAFADDPQVLDDQLAAIAEAAEQTEADVWVMAPMVTTVDEAVDFARRCGRHGLTTPGMTIEVPAAALRAESILANMAFASMGTNDLTQYTMAADRRVSDLSHLCTPWQPAVLELVTLSCRAAEHHDRPMGVCGEAAADPALAVVLVGLGVTSLSMTTRALGDVGAVLASVTMDRCRELAEVALASSDAEKARESVRAGLPILADLGL